MRLPVERLRQLEAQLDESRRWVDMAMQLTDGGGRATPMLGGRWDTWLQRWTDDAVAPLRVSLNGEQWDALTWRPRRSAVRLVCGGIGAGKTHLGCLAMAIEAGIRYPGDRFWIVAPSYKYLRNDWRKILKIMPRGWVRHVAKSDRIITLANGSTLEFRSADNPGALEGDDIRGALIDEPASCPSDTYEMVRQRMARNVGGWCLVLTGTPRDTIADLIDTLEAPTARGQREGRVFYLTSTLNRWVDASEYERLGDVLDERELARVVGGRLLPAHDRVFHAYEPASHLRSPPVGARDVTQRVIAERFDGVAPRYGFLPEVVIGADFNWAAGRPMSWVALRAYEMPGTAQGWAWWVVDEIVQHNVTLEEQAMATLERYRGGAFVVYDSATKMTKDLRPVDVLRHFEGLVLEPAGTIGQNPRQRAAVDSVNGALKPASGKAPFLYVAPRSTTFTQRSLKQLRWGPDGRIWHGSSPSDDDSHCGDALKYAVHKFSPHAEIVGALRARLEREAA